MLLRISTSITLLLCVAGLEIWPGFRPHTAVPLELLEVVWAPQTRALRWREFWRGSGLGWREEGC